MKEKIEQYIKTWEGRCYSNGIPDEVPSRLTELNKAPSYRQIAIAIMKNDNHLETLGFSRPKCLAYDNIKRAELIQRKVIKVVQLRLFK